MKRFTILKRVFVTLIAFATLLTLNAVGQEESELDTHKARME